MRHTQHRTQHVGVPTRNMVACKQNRPHRPPALALVLLQRHPTLPTTPLAHRGGVCNPRQGYRPPSTLPCNHTQGAGTAEAPHAEVDAVVVVDVHPTLAVVVGSSL